VWAAEQPVIRDWWRAKHGSPQGKKKSITKKWYKQPTRAFPMEYKNIYLSLCNCSRYYVKTLP
jgi:hypothetical protein